MKISLKLAFHFIIRISAPVIPRRHSNWLGSLIGSLIGPGIGVAAHTGAGGSINIGEVFLFQCILVSLAEKMDLKVKTA